MPSQRSTCVNAGDADTVLRARSAASRRLSFGHRPASITMITSRGAIVLHGTAAILRPEAHGKIKWRGSPTRRRSRKGQDVAAQPTASGRRRPGENVLDVPVLIGIGDRQGGELITGGCEKLRDLPALAL